MTRGRPPTHSREALLEIGNSLFQLHGYHGTSLSMILEACGVSRGSFYNFFGGKEAYAIEVIEHYQVLEMDCWQEEFSRLEGSHAAKMQIMMRRLIEEFSISNERIGGLLANLSGEMALASDNFRAAIRNAISRVLHAITDDIRICQEEGTVRTDLPANELAQLIWDYWQGAVLRMKTENSRAPLYQAVDMLWQNLLPPQQL
ncbi:TetR/AcrR family transcriptional regulator [Marinobacterium sediminicola]|uniref:Transcriptional regulator, TetR family n=1 Tax=Marinobacterium sediminicola TaxID=518898 RepID=A0ABY1RW23_9GAMM|nr:TetR/AcrR family transcriptional regulator [Marinobacterium sediminicola]ULG70522.1 TetR/AcrR family transcriptional regulator [Marinobacterium sediminicola]SMR69106.1 transcriptional regulator, TetR family [Marinobacterium sediminicola]